jgi:glycosyltransferase involved in cell wall biosynthesis
MPRARSALGIPADALVVGAVGRLVPQKGFPDLLAAFRRVADRFGDTAHLVIVGSGPDLDALREQARALGIGRRVLLTGFRNDVREIMPSFDVMAFSSLYEGLPVALLEAMACGVAVVATSVPGLVEVLADRQNALMVPARSPEALADALCYALRNPEARRALSASGRDLFRKRYTADRMVEHYAAVYRELMARGGVGE